MNSDSRRLVLLLAVGLPLLFPGVSRAMVPVDSMDTSLARKAVRENPCGVCHSKPDYEQISYDKWKPLIKRVPDGMMPVKGSEERARVLRAIETGEVNGFYRSRCSNCHELPDPDSLDYADWKGRLYRLTGLEMPVMSTETKRSVLSELARANERESSYNPRSDWFELPKTRRKAPLPGPLKSSTEGSNLLLHFWSPGCTPCREELPEFKDFVRSVADTDTLEVRIIAVTRKKATTRRLLSPIATKRIYFDSSKSLTNRLKVGSFPTNYLVGRDGKFIARMVGRRPWHKKNYRRALLKLLRRNNSDKNNS